MKISFVILNYKTYEMTLALVAQIRQRITRTEYEIIVVDNASPNESAAVLRESEEKYIFIENDKNAGYAAGNNIGIRYAVKRNAEYVLVMNNDIEIPSEDVIIRLINLLDSNEKIGAASPCIIDGKGKHDPPIYYKKPSYWELTLGIFSYQKNRFKFDETKNARVYAPRGSFMILRSSAINLVNYLDENTFLYYEEPILAERFEKEGYQCWHCGETTVIHNHAVTISSTFSKKKMAENVCKSYKYYLRQYRHYNTLAIGICSLIRYLAIMIRR